MKIASIALGGLPGLLRFAAKDQTTSDIRSMPRNVAKKAGTVLLAMLLLGSIGSLAQQPPPTFTAATAMTNVANAIEQGLNGMSAGGDGGGVMQIGRSLFGFFIVANLVWMLLKSFVSGTGFFNGFIADFVPFAITAGVVTIFLDRDVAGVLKSSLDVLGSAILGEGVSSVADMIAAAGQQAFQAVANVWNVAPATQVSWDPTSWFAAIPAVLYALVGTAGTVFFILVALAIYIANLVMSQVAIIIAIIFAPFFVPFLLFKPAAWLFEGWLRFFLGAGMMKIIGLLMLKITSNMMGSLVTLSQQAAAAKPGVLDAVSIDIVLFSSMVLLAGISALLMSQVPSLATGLLSGSAGGAGFGSWANLASKSPATRMITGGMGDRGGAGGRSGQATNAASGVTRMMPNVLKPASAAAGSVTSRFLGAGLARRDMAAAKDVVRNGERNIGRDLSRMSSATASSYVKRLEAANQRMGASEPRYTVSKPVSSTTPKAGPK
jgi:hypothetical protein